MATAAQGATFGVVKGRSRPVRRDRFGKITANWPGHAIDRQEQTA